MTKRIFENRDGTFSALAGVRIKRCVTRVEAQAFLDSFSSRCHSDPVVNDYAATK